MSKRLGTNFTIAIVGLGFAVGALATVLSVPTLVLLAVGLGVTVGAIYRELSSVSARVASIAAGDTDEGTR